VSRSRFGTGTPLKVLLSGTFSAGKTTTLHSLVDRCKGSGINCALRTEPARACPLPLDLGQHATTSAWLMGEIIKAESFLLGQDDVDVVLCDGGPPDVLAHTRSPSGREVILGLCEAWQPTYDRVFWARPDPDRPIEPDGLRLADEEYRTAVDTAVAAALDTLRIAAVELPGAMSDRVDLMFDVLAR
jgi:hypothetical protein